MSIFKDFRASSDMGLSVNPWTVGAKAGYDLMIAALGYEERATFAAKQLGDSASRKIAFGFMHRQVLHFKENMDWFLKAGFEVIESKDGEEFELAAEAALKSQSRITGDRQIRVCVDISSFSRQRLAFLTSLLLRHLEGKPIVDFVYAPSTFAPPQEDDLPISYCEPVTSEFGAWPVGTDLPTALICGLGYERDRALGVEEYLDAAGSWLFFPTGPIPEFVPEVRKANAELLEGFPPDRVIYYDLATPFATFARLQSLVSGLVDSYRPVLVPLGPKPFALATLLVGLAHSPHVSVWRVSAGQAEEPVDRPPQGDLVGLTVSPD